MIPPISTQTIPPVQPKTMNQILHLSNKHISCQHSLPSLSQNAGNKVEVKNEAAQIGNIFKEL